MVEFALRGGMSCGADRIARDLCGCTACRGKRHDDMSLSYDILRIQSSSTTAEASSI